MSKGRVHRRILRQPTSLRGTSRFVGSSPIRMPGSRVRAAVVALVIPLLALTVSVPIARAAACCPGEARAWKRCEVLQPIGGALSVRFPEDTSWASLAFGTMQLEDAARSLRRPRHALVMFADANGVRTLTALGVRMDRRIRVVAGLGVGALLLLVAALLTGGRLAALALGQDGRYSTSKTQMLVWFSVLIVSYGTTIALRWWAGGGQFAGAVGVPDNLLLLSGLSALSFVGAKAITQGKDDRAAALLRAHPALAPDTPRKLPSSRSRFPADLVNDDHGRLDFGDFQMMVVTLLAVGVYVVRVFVCLGQVELACATRLPDVDTTILAAFGLGQGAYLAKKAASHPGDG